MKEFKPAFPTNGFRTGISQRLYIATKIACAIIANTNLEEFKSYNDIVRDSYIVADALIKQEETE